MIPVLAFQTFLHSAIRAFTVCLKALYINDGDLPSTEWLTIRRSLGEAIRPLIPELLSIFWDVRDSVLAYPVSSYPVSTSREELPEDLGSVMADCVIAIGNYYEAIRRYVTSS